MEEKLQLKENAEEHIKPVHEKNEVTCDHDTLEEQPLSSVLHDSHINTNVGSQKNNFKSEKCNKMQTRALSDDSFYEINTTNEAENNEECYAESGGTNCNFNGCGSDKMLFLSGSSKHIGIEDISLKNGCSLTFSPGLSREELLEKYHKAIEQRKELKKISQELQQKVIHHFRSKSSNLPQEVDNNVNNPKQHYESYMNNLVELRRKLQYEKAIYNKQTEELRSIHKSKEDEIQSEVAKFVKMKKEIAQNAINSYTGKKLSKQEVEFYLKREEQSDQVLRKIQLRNFKTVHQLQKIEQQLKAKEELAEGIHLIDFEQLKIENQTYHEKIEERNEKRSYMVKLKTSRDSLRSQMQKLQQKAGLFRRKILLRDYEETVNRKDQLENEMVELKIQFEFVNLSLSELQKNKKSSNNKEHQQTVDHQLKSARYTIFGNHLK
ncbi:cilia- and flagella-associated protein 184-like isoform X2 [Tachypleus tridentatus]|uniref:cilia- and flagella-associated protein 184-like isoform X2 n=1 Tax=Tachypleus tridentatus TaxID=6853 RepID=UPI003FD127A2